MSLPLRASGMIAFAEAADAIAATPAKLEKIALLAAYLRTLDNADLVPATRFFTGNPFAARDHCTLSLGGRTIGTAAESVWEISPDAMRAAYRETGDTGEALGRFVRPPRDLVFFTETLAPAALLLLFEQMSAASGKSAGRTRMLLCERILRACTDAREATYVIKIMTGDLRIGLKEGLVLDAIAQAFDADGGDVRRAAMAAGDVGAVAVAAKHGELAAIRPSYGAPIGFMLATPIPYGELYADLDAASWRVEDKYDGIRAQAHVRGGVARLYSRTLNDVTHSYPEVARALATLSGDAILDGEIVAVRNGRMLPFRFLQARLQRKSIDDALLREVPVRFVAFDVLADGEMLLVDEPLEARRKRLETLIGNGDHLELAPQDSVADATAVNAFFAAARERGNEGIVLKREDAPYYPGRRGKWWLKLKRELATLDVVVVAVEWGHGKRAKVLSDYTFAVRGPGDELLTIGKAYSGLTDVEIAELTQWFLAHMTGERRGYAHVVEPEIVLEVAFDIIQESDLHQSGFSLRFPRIVRIRDDKPASEIDTLDRVKEIYAEMLAREGLSQ